MSRKINRRIGLLKGLTVIAVSREWYVADRAMHMLPCSMVCRTWLRDAQGRKWYALVVLARDARKIRHALRQAKDPELLIGRDMDHAVNLG